MSDKINTNTSMDMSYLYQQLSRQPRRQYTNMFQTCKRILIDNHIVLHNQHGQALQWTPFIMLQFILSVSVWVTNCNQCEYINFIDENLRWLIKSNMVRHIQLYIRSGYNLNRVIDMQQVQTQHNRMFLCCFNCSTSSRQVVYLTSLDLAILYGHYSIAYSIYTSDCRPELKSEKQYAQCSGCYHENRIDYGSIVRALQGGVTPEQWAWNEHIKSGVINMIGSIIKMEMNQQTQIAQYTQ